MSGNSSRINIISNTTKNKTKKPIIFFKNSVSNSKVIIDNSVGKSPSSVRFGSKRKRNKSIKAENRKSEQKNFLMNKIKRRKKNPKNRRKVANVDWESFVKKVSHQKKSKNFVIQENKKKNFFEFYKPRGKIGMMPEIAKKRILTEVKSRKKLKSRLKYNQPKEASRSKSKPSSRRKLDKRLLYDDKKVKKKRSRDPKKHKKSRKKLSQNHFNPKKNVKNIKKFTEEDEKSKNNFALRNLSMEETTVLWDPENGNKEWPHFSKHLHFGQCLGQGSFAKVYEAIDKHSKQNVAVKVIDKRKILNHKKRLLVQNEIDILAKLDHTNLIRFHRLVEDKKRVRYYPLYNIIDFHCNGDGW